MSIRTLALVTLLAVACSPSTNDPAEIAEEATTKLDEIRSGNLVFSLIGENGDDTVGFSLAGRFSLGEDGELPQADVTYTGLMGTDSFERRLVSTGEAAFVEEEGAFYELPAGSLSGLTSAAAGEPFLDELDVASWLVRPDLESSEFDGVDTDLISADLDVVAFFDDLLQASEAVGADLGGAAIEESDAEQLRSAVEDANIVIEAGREDRLVRRLEVEVAFSLEDSSVLAKHLGPLVAPSITLSVEITGVNEPVEIEAPEGVAEP